MPIIVKGMDWSMKESHNNDFRTKTRLYGRCLIQTKTTFVSWKYQSLVPASERTQESLNLSKTARGFHCTNLKKTRFGHILAGLIEPGSCQRTSATGVGKVIRRPGRLPGRLGVGPSDVEVGSGLGSFNWSNLAIKIRISRMLGRNSGWIGCTNAESKYNLMTELV